jgi:hypothetical protein
MLTVTNAQIRLMMDNIHEATAERVLFALEAQAPDLLRWVPRGLRKTVAKAAVAMAAEHGIARDPDIVRLLAGLLATAGPSQARPGRPQRPKDHEV